MNKVSCEIIRDLLPSVADGIAGGETVSMVEEHVGDCEACREALEAMRRDRPEEAGDRQEIDYLKKNRRRNRRIVLISVLAACLAVLAFIALRLFVIGEYSNGENVALKVDVDGRRVSVTAEVTDSARVIRKFEFAEKDGVVTVKARTVLVGLVHGVKSASYEAKEDVKKVAFGNICYLNMEKDEMYSDAMRNDIVIDWQRWKEKTDAQIMLESRMPGHLSRRFDTWESAVDYLGFAPFNPLEDCPWLEKMNYAGTDIEDGLHSDTLNHAYIYYAGDENGNVNYLKLDAGYRWKPQETAAVTLEDGSIEPALAEYPADAGIPAIVSEDGNSPEIHTVTLSGIRFVYTVEPVFRASEGAYDEQRELAGGQLMLIRRSHSDKWRSVDIMFDLDGIHYTVRIVGDADEDSINEAANMMISYLESKMR